MLFMPPALMLLHITHVVWGLKVSLRPYSDFHYSTICLMQWPLRT